MLKENYRHIWNQLPWICLVAKFGAKLKILKFGTTNTWFCYFWVRILKKYYYIMKSSTPSILPNCKILQKISTFGTTNALFGYFWAGIFKKTIVIFEISTLKFVNLKILPKKKRKSLSLWLKMSYFIFGYIGARILKNYCHIWNQHHQICLNAKFREKIKMPKLGSKNGLFGYFWARHLKRYCHIWNQHPRIRLMAKSRKKTKTSKFGIKNA